MADREVTLKIGSRSQGDLAKPMKDLARGAREAGSAVEDVDKKLKRLATEHDKALVRQGRLNAAARAGGGTGSGGGGGTGGGGTGGGAGKALGQVAGRFGFGGGGGAAGAALAALAAGNKGVELLQHGGPFGQGAFNAGKFSGGGLADTAIWESGKLPLIGSIMKMSNEYEKLEERVRRVQQAEEALHVTEQRIALTREFTARRVGLGDELARAGARLQFGSSSMSAQFAIGTAGQYRAERAMAGAVPYGQAGASARGDIEARVGFETKLARQEVEQERQKKLHSADRFRTENLVLERQQKLIDARKAADATRKGLGFAQQHAGGEPPGFFGKAWETAKLPFYAHGVKKKDYHGFGGDGGGGKPGFTTDQIDERRLQHEKALLEVQEAERQLQEALARQREQSLARGDTLLEQQRERLGLMEQERDRLTGIVRQERERLQAAKEQFGLQNPQTKFTLLQLSRKIKAGGALSEREIGYLQQHGGDLFRPALAAEGRRRAGPAYDEVVANLGAGERLKGVEQARVALESKITIEIKKNEQSVEDVVKKEVIPEIHKAFYELERAFTTAIEKAKNDHRDQRAPAAGG